MKKIILTIALLAFTTTTALAGGYGYGPRGGYNGYNGYRGGNGWNYGAAALGGAIIGGAEDTAAAKMKIMRECGIHVVESPAEIGDTVLKVLKK
jgi:hypothetical protein